MSQRRPGISVIVCTHNGAARLPATLAALKLAAARAACFCEILVVDNRSSDGTAAAIAAAAVGSPVKLVAVHEERLGLSHARNRGVAEAACEICAFTDDDVTVAPDWIAMIEAVFADPAIAAAGGRILPESGRSLPGWLTKDLRYHFALLDLGDQPMTLVQADVWGANIIFRSGCFDRHGGFDPQLGRIGDRLFLGEETEFVDRLLRAGERVVYDPRLQVEHRLPPERLTQAYICRRMFDLGEQDANRSTQAYRSLCGVPVWAFNQIVQTQLRLLDPRLDRDGARLRLKLRRNHTIGFARASWRRWRGQGAVS